MTDAGDSGNRAADGAAAATADGAEADSARAERGMAVRRQVLGDEHVDRATAGMTDFTAPFQDLITRYAWGEIWSRPGLTRPERSMITITALAALRQEEELALHVRAALRNGLTEAQITEVLLQVAIYAGVPAANRAFAIAQRVLAEVSGQLGEASGQLGEASGQLGEASGQLGEASGQLGEVSGQAAPADE
jgi:4-carboxymuconolactone decarboxylase